jgi:hypothetical protein
MPSKVKAAILLITLLFSIASVGFTAQEYFYPVNISGKIFNKDGSLFKEKVTLEILATTAFYNPEEEGAFSDVYKTYEQEASGGYFNWNGQALDVSIQVKCEGYHSTSVLMVKNKGEALINREGVLIYLIPEGNKSSLQYTEGAYIPGKKDKESSGRQCGWSFTKRWYYPVDGDISVDITRGANENKKRVYTMKEPGGFVYFEGYPKFENSTERNYAGFDLMPEAPETGYVSTFAPAEHMRDDRDRYFCYFKTPDGKYGKICFEGDFSYYINPDGSRNLEAGEVEEWDPINPIEADRHKH